MAQAALKPWTVDEFFAWQVRQEERYEFVDGFPVRLMAGASNRHDDLVTNTLIALGTRLKGRACRLFTGDGAVQTVGKQIRRPDAGIDCGRREPDAFKAVEPRLVVEVLSPSTRDFDTMEKLNEYKSVETIDYILYVEPNEPQVMVWSRDAERRWQRGRVTTRDGIIDLPSLDLTLPLAEIYDGVDVPDGPAPPGHWMRRAAA